ncbi:MAG TPA: glycogen debranching protein GlgX [Acidobacteriota bacterium]|nr:glycogen debranching protein GlgX [Acidobacteriota bacterium]
MPMQHSARPGDPSPLGATIANGGVNFSLFSQRATSVELLLFENFDDPEPYQILAFHPFHNKTFFYWHIFVEGAGEGQIYAYRVDGPFDPFEGHRFNRNKILVDPYSKGVVYGGNWSREDARHPYPNIRSAMKSLVVDAQRYDWEGVSSPNVPMTETIIYELHVRGFTRHPSSGVQYPGTLNGLVEKIPYLKELGITTVELLPIHEFDSTEWNFKNPETGKPNVNYWGYNTICFFSPHRPYYIESWEEMAYTTGFRDMVKAFHRAGIEVVLDVVFNHTCEGDERGPTMSFRGLENSVYYLLNRNDKRKYANYSGCGNTMNCNHPIVRRMILDSLRYWVQVMHVDGFRFDLASILSRDEKGEPMENPPLLWEIESDPVLQKAKIIAEAWDAAGLYQVGNFPGERWAEWNGRYRDDVRRFLRSDSGMVGALASRIAGSADLYERLGREPHQSINYITCHDGFTLNDLVSYNHKHNLANGEENRDGSNDNHSFNWGVEGPSNDAEIEKLRRRQIRNFAVILLLSQGTPMLLAGDEFRRTQSGNNNAYCQDNEISWIDWTLLQKERDLFRFFREMIRFRKAHFTLKRRDYFFGERDSRGWSEINWHGIQLGKPDWGFDSHSLAFTLSGFGKDNDIHALINAWREPLEFELPVLSSKQNWYRSIDTFLATPHDISEEGNEERVTAMSYKVEPFSVVVLISR